MTSEMRNAIERTLQGLAYWIAYKKELISIDLIEADIVSEAAHLLLSRLSNYYIKKEVDYTTLNSALRKQYADLGIFSREDNKCVCIIEFKRENNTNGGYKKDVQKLKRVKELEPNIICLAVVTYEKSCRLKDPNKLVTPNGKAKRGIIKDSGDAQVKVRRVCNALASKSANKMKKVVCLEVVK